MLLIRGTTAGTWYATAKRWSGAAWLYYRTDAQPAEAYSALNLAAYLIALTREVASGDAYAGTPAGMVGEAWEAGYHLQRGGTADLAADLVSGERVGADGEPVANGGGAATVQVLPLQVTVSSNRFTTAGGANLPLSMAQHESIAFLFNVVDETGAAVVMTGRTVRMLAHDDAGAVRWTRETGGNGITIDGSQVTVTVSETQSATVARYAYKLRDITGKKLLASGTFEVKLAPIG